MAELRQVKMVANGNLRKGSEVTPHIAPLVSCLHSSDLPKRCSACFKILDETTLPELLPMIRVRYCSLDCYNIDSPLHFMSGEDKLLEMLDEDPKLFTEDESTYLRIALRFLVLFPPDSDVFTPYTNPNSINDFYPNRILGLFYHDNNNINSIFLSLMVRARAAANIVPSWCIAALEDNFESIACSLAFTNAVKVGTWGLALFDHRISMINHCCDPNAELVFHSFSNSNPKPANSPMLIKPMHSLIDKMLYRRTSEELGFDNFNFGPRGTVKLLREVKEGEEITISYVDSSILRDEELKSVYLRENYKMTCRCHICCKLILEKTKRLMSLEKMKRLMRTRPSSAMSTEGSGEVESSKSRRLR